MTAGTKIVLKLKSDEGSFSQRFAVEQNIRKYSNFVGFPIYVDEDRVNTVEAIWAKSKNEVTPEQHSEFYQYIAQVFTRVSVSSTSTSRRSLTRVSVVSSTSTLRRPDSCCARISTSTAS